ASRARWKRLLPLGDRMTNQATGHRPRATGVAVFLLCISALGGCQMAGGGEPSTPSTYGLGTAASAAEIAALNTDVAPDGTGLPRGSGDATKGAGLCAAQGGAGPGRAAERRRGA